MKKTVIFISILLVATLVVAFQINTFNALLKEYGLQLISHQIVADYREWLTFDAQYVDQYSFDRYGSRWNYKDGFINDFLGKGFIVLGESCSKDHDEMINIGRNSFTNEQEIKTLYEIMESRLIKSVTELKVINNAITDLERFKRNISGDFPKKFFKQKNELQTGIEKISSKIDSLDNDRWVLQRKIDDIKWGHSEGDTLALQKEKEEIINKISQLTEEGKKLTTELNELLVEYQFNQNDYGFGQEYPHLAQAASWAANQLKEKLLEKKLTEKTYISW